MVSSILGRWPHLKDGLDINDALSRWKYRLRTNFKNTRRRTDSAVSTVVMMKKKYMKRKLLDCQEPANDNSNQQMTVSNSNNKLQDDQTSVKSANNENLFWGIENFLPQRCVGEDERSLRLYEQVLLEQFKLTSAKRNTYSIESAMIKTFPERRNMLITEMKRTSEILSRYPILACEEMVSVIFYSFICM